MEFDHQRGSRAAYPTFVWLVAGLLLASTFLPWFHTRWQPSPNERVYSAWTDAWDSSALWSTALLWSLGATLFWLLWRANLAYLSTGAAYTCSAIPLVGSAIALWEWLVLLRATPPGVATEMAVAYAYRGVDDIDLPAPPTTHDIVRDRLFTYHDQYTQTGPGFAMYIGIAAMVALSITMIVATRRALRPAKPLTRG